MNFIKNGRVYDVMPCADSFNDIHEIKCGQAEEKLEAGGDEKLIFNFIWPYRKILHDFFILTLGRTHPFFEFETHPFAVNENYHE